MAKFSYSDFEKMGNSSGEGHNVGYFSLKDDGDEAIVRFNLDSVDDLEVLSIHKVAVNGKWRSVNCARDPHAPVTECPLCASGNKLFTNIYIPMLVYTKDEQGHTIVSAKIWERSVSFAKRLAALIQEYGTLKDCVFKVKRYGAAKSTQTTYDIRFANPSIHREDLYPKNFEAFNGFSVVGTQVLNKTVPELIAMLTGGEEDVPPIPPMPEEPVMKAYNTSRQVDVDASTLTNVDARRTAPWENTTFNAVDSNRPVRRY